MASSYYVGQHSWGEQGCSHLTYAHRSLRDRAADSASVSQYKLALNSPVLIQLSVKFCILLHCVTGAILIFKNEQISSQIFKYISGTHQVNSVALRIKVIEQGERAGVCWVGDCTGRT